VLKTLFALLVLASSPVVAAAQSVPAPHQVLVLQSMDRGSLVFDSFTAEFRAALQRLAGTRVTLLDFVVAPAGLTEAPEKPVIAFLDSIYADRRSPDLLVTIGGPAAAFVRRNRAQLFPAIPVLYAAVETRFLSNAPLAMNETSVTVSIDYAGLIDDILQLLPETRNVLMVTGSGPLAAFWRAELQTNFERFRDRLSFIWSDEMSYEQVLQRAATLPPNSAIFYISAGTFAVGSWQGDERTFADLSARAVAPIFGAQRAWLGAGIVGGRLLEIEDLGNTTAEVVVRLLSGESATAIKIPPRSIGPAIFDARQLGRWNIPEARLPSGSELRFRGPSLWRDYRGEILGASAVFLMQAVLIVGLLYQRRARRRAELESRRSLSLAADANRRITMAALTGSMAHELSQPLNAILHNVQAGEMMMSANRATPDILRDILADIRTADVRATEIVERHRTMLRNRPHDARPIDIHAVLRESIALVATDARHRDIQVDVNLPPVPCFVVGDGVLLQQVAVNLLINAMDAMTDGAAARRRIAVSSDIGAKGNVTFSVSDTGTGLPPASNGHLFEPFVTTKANGMGIGLTIVRTIVEAHRGKIAAYNNADGGATFTVTLPCAES
jgi:signal transduction histidine kinase